jgi:hypothetical protein
MNSAKEILQQLNHLVLNIKECNFIPNEDRKDIVQQSMLKMLEKYNEGVIVDDFKQMKNYSFITLRNFCTLYKTKKKPIYSDSDFSHITEEDNYIDKEHREHLIELIRTQYSNSKIKEDDIKLCEMILNNYNNEEMAAEYGINLYKLGRKKHGVTLKLKNLFKKKFKYYIKDINRPYYCIGCKSSREVSNYFPNETLRNVKEKIYNKKLFKDGRYIETIKPE